MSAYYNEIDPFAAEWLRNLINRNLIAPGEVDQRSIEDVYPDDLRGFKQCHFFAGIGAWSYALRKARWEDDRPVWTGSCPCQPFSAAGKGAGFDDERHLWPAFHWLIQECRPVCVFGEQVASSSTDEWFDLIQADLEAMDYVFGLVPFPAASVGAPHIRDRAYWMANTSSQGLERRKRMYERRPQSIVGAGSVVGRLAYASQQRCNGIDALLCRNEPGRQPEDSAQATRRSSANGFWRDADWLYCRDGKWRPVEPGTFPLASRIAKGMGRGKSSLGAMAGRNRVGRLKGYGNALNAEAATAFISAVMECMP